MPYADVGSLKLYYEKRGHGPRLLFLSGTGGDLKKNPFMFKTPLASRFEILAFDPRGLGSSGKPEGPYTMADYAKDARRLLRHVGWSRCHVFGASFGGMVAQEFALAYPDCVAKLVLGVTCSGGAGGSSFPLHELADLPPEAYVRTNLRLLDTRWDEAWAAAHPEVVEARLKGHQAKDEASRRGSYFQLQARRMHDTYDRLPGLHVPAMVFAGRFDRVALAADVATLAGRIEGAQFKLFDHGHTSWAQDDDVWGEIADFLEGDAAGKA